MSGRGATLTAMRPHGGLSIESSLRNVGFVCALAAGCHADGTDGPPGEGGGSTGGATAGSGAGASTGGLGSSGGPASSSGGGTTGGDGGDLMPTGCDGVDCSPGTCVLVAGNPTCDCPPDYGDVGGRCVPCNAAGAELIVPLTTALVTPSVTINGQPAPPSNYEDGRLWLVNRASGDRVGLGTSAAPVAARVLQGTYDVLWELEDGGALVPHNAAGFLTTVTITGDAPLAIDVPMARMTGAFTVAGQPAPASVYESGDLVLVTDKTGDEVRLGATHEGTYAVHLIPGIYAIHYRLRQGGMLVPINADVRIGTVEVGLEWAGAEVDFAFDVDIPMIAAEGLVTLGGATPPTSQYDDGRIVLRDALTGTELDVGSTNAGTWAANIVPQIYDIRYRAEDTQGGTVPVNADAYLETWNFVERAVHDIDVPVVQVAGDFLVDGATPPLSAYESGRISLCSREGDEAPLGATHGGAFQVPVVPGIYDVCYGVASTTGLMPVNQAARVVTDVDPAAGPLTIDILTTVVSGGFTLAGAAPPASAYEDGVVFLRTDAGDHALLGHTSDMSYVRRVVTGAYDLGYGLENGGAVVPVNRDAQLATGIAVNLGGALDVDVGASTLQGAAMLDGVDPPADATDSGKLYLRDAATHERIALGATHSGTFSRVVASGTYVIEYAAPPAPVTLPGNQQAALACVVVP
jgi:hypothetical protein